MITGKEGALVRPALRVRHLLWAGPLVFLVHDAEEIATVEAWTRRNLEIVPEPLRAHLPVTTQEFAWSVALIFVAFVGASVADLLRLRGGARPSWSILATAILVANAVTHLLQMLLFGGYTPGVVTAAVLVLPFGVWVYRLGREQGWLDPWTALRLLIVGALLQIPLAPVALLGGRLLGA